ncbi:hypothetical protein [Paenarthrobacter sp. TA1.8]|uniref:hypothetical protein n=1 Tax=Paenarthrobacter sp. TA1.8 TaxID=3400219 RepID=UPI003B431FA4
MNFFEDFPKPEPVERPKSVKFVPPPWAGPSQDELPTVMHIGQFLHRSPNLVLMVKSADVFRTGCLFEVSWIIRRHEENDEEWSILHSSVFQHGPVRGPSSEDLQLLFGVELPDGTKARTTVFGMGSFLDPNNQPEAPVLSFRGGGGGGGDDELSSSGNLWLWPLPADGDIRLLAQWKGLGVEECSIVIDGSQLSAAAAGVQSLWR